MTYLHFCLSFAPLVYKYSLKEGSWYVNMQSILLLDYKANKLIILAKWKWHFSIILGEEKSEDLESTQFLALIPISSRSILILSSHLRLGLPKDIFPVG